MNTENQDDEIHIDEYVRVEPKEPLQNIALMFSGGGFRAACFSLGALSYLNRIKYKNKPVLEGVRFTTSTSGGSITNAYYAVRLYRDQPFDFNRFYQDLRTAMDGEDLLKNVFEILKDLDQWPEDGEYFNDKGVKTKVAKNRNLINAFAKAYDKCLYDNAMLSSISDQVHATPTKPHLQEICFNTTEFNNGMNFYFQVSGFDHKVRPRGNSYLRFHDWDTAKKAKISDIVAASSCFPSGFEPIIYPTDFVHAGCTNVNEMLNGITYTHNNPLELNKIAGKPFALMDGGITDNMGIHSVLIRDGDRYGEKFDLILSCDVTSYFNDPLEKDGPAPKGFFANLSIQAIVNCLKVFIIIFLLSAASIITKTIPVLGYLLLIPSAIVSFVYLLGAYKLRKLKKNSSGTTGIGLRYLGYFLKLPLSSVVPLIRQRLRSSLKLVTDMFLKQIRRGQYEHMFSQPLMKDRAISCLIYEFSSAHQERRLKNLESNDKAWWPAMSSLLMPGDKIQKMVDTARSMGTTLWFDESEKEKKDLIIATGQLTVCYSLIKHLCRLEVLDSKYAGNKELQDLKVRLIEDWKRFKEDPSFMIDDIG